jgi:hypothetical protein
VREEVRGVRKEGRARGFWSLLATRGRPWRCSGRRRAGREQGELGIGLGRISEGVGAGVSEGDREESWGVLKKASKLCQYVAPAVWPRSAASADRRKGTRKRAGSAPKSQGEWDVSDGEGMGQEEVGRLREGRPNARPPSV